MMFLYKGASSSKNTSTKTQDFIGGLDPFGNFTSEYGRKNQQAQMSKGEHRKRRAISTAGGLVGGGILVPAVSSSVYEGIKGYGSITGGMKKKLLGAGTGALKGLKSPFKSLMGGRKAVKMVKSVADTGRIPTKEEMGLVKNLAKNVPIGGLTDAAESGGMKKILDSMRSGGGGEAKKAIQEARDIIVENAKKHSPINLSAARSLQKDPARAKRRFTDSVKRSISKRTPLDISKADAIAKDPRGALKGVANDVFEGAKKRMVDGLSGSKLDDLAGMTKKRVEDIVQGAGKSSKKDLLASVNARSPISKRKLQAARKDSGKKMTEGLRQDANRIASSQSPIDVEKANRLKRDPKEVAKDILKDSTSDLSKKHSVKDVSDLWEGDIGQNIRKDMAKRALPGIRGTLNGVKAGFGISAGVGGLGAYAQYGKGRRMEKDFQKRLHKNEDKNNR